MGERYFWIDALCIDQADSAHKAFLVSKMEVVYRHAFAVVITADSDHADAGLHRLRTTGIPDETIAFVQDNQLTQLCPTRMSMVAALKEST